MFLVSWSLFSRLSRMKDKVSSSWGRRGGDISCSPREGAPSLHQGPDPALLLPSTCPGPGAQHPPAACNLQSHLLQFVLDLPPPGRRLLRGDHRGDPDAVPPQANASKGSLGFRPCRHATPTSGRSPAPSGENGILLDKFGGSVSAIQQAAGPGGHVECGRPVFTLVQGLCASSD